MANRVVTFQEVFGKEPPPTNPKWAPVSPPATCPAVSELYDTLLSFDFFRGKSWFDSQSIVQKYAPAELTRHNAGLALDIILISPRHPNFMHPTTKQTTLTEAQESLADYDQAVAHHLVKAFIELKQKMNFRGLIYENVTFDKTASYVPRPYTDDTRHFTHIHIDWLNLSLVKWKAKGYAIE